MQYERRGTGFMQRGEKIASAFKSSTLDIRPAGTAA